MTEQPWLVVAGRYLSFDRTSDGGTAAASRPEAREIAARIFEAARRAES
jgi:hypothetical protein